MGRLWRNPEYRALAVRMLLLLAVLTAALCVLSALLANALQDKAAEQAAAVVGKALKAHPELESDIIGAAIVPASEEDIRRGRAALAAYGYGADTPVRDDPIIGGQYLLIFAAALGAMAIVAASVLWLVTGGFLNVYKIARTFAEAAERAVDGDFDTKLPSGGEGDFAILGHRFNQMTNRMRLNVEQLMAEKAFLRNTISDISHQLKTPLSSLIVYNDLMTENEGMDREQRLNFLALGHRQLERLEWLIQGLLKMARLEAGSVLFRREPVKLVEIARSAVSALNAMAQEAGVTVSIVELQPDACFLGDGPWLAEAVINILKNGIEHSPAGGAVEMRVGQTPLTAFLSVADRGEGISAEDLPRVFERFYRGTQAVKPNSIGIGLAMAKAIVEGQGGTISVKSERGRGSEFTIVFLKTVGE